MFMTNTFRINIINRYATFNIEIANDKNIDINVLLKHRPKLKFAWPIFLDKTQSGNVYIGYIFHGK